MSGAVGPAGLGGGSSCPLVYILVPPFSPHVLGAAVHDSGLAMDLVGIHSPISCVTQDNAFLLLGSSVSLLPRRSGAELLLSQILSATGLWEARTVMDTGNVRLGSVL